MKTLRKIFLTLSFLLTSVCLMQAFADNPLDQPPPPPGGGHGGGGNQQGAPIDGGIGILLALGAGYGKPCDDQFCTVMFLTFIFLANVATV